MTRSTARTLRPLLLGLMLAAAIATVIADVVLNPGYIAGTYTVSGVTITQATFQASAGNQSSSVNGTAGAYQMTVNVPTGGSQAFSLSAYFYSDQGRDYLQVPTRTVTVADGVQTTENYSIAPGFIQGTLTVNGGTPTSAFFSANAAVAPSSYAQTSLVAPYTTFHFPVHPGTHNVSGSVTVSGVNYSLTSQQVAVAAGQTVNLNFVVTASQHTGSITGNVQFSGLAPVRVDVSASGPASPTAQLTPPGSYALTGLPNGNYSMYAYARYNNLQDYIYLPNSAFPSSSRQATISGGGSVVRDISFTSRSVSGAVAVTGPRTLSQVNYGQIIVTGVSPSAAAGGQAFTRLQLPSGSFLLPATDGTWRPIVYLQFFDSNPQTYLNSAIEITDFRPASMFAVTSSTTVAPITYDVGTVTVVMSVPPPLTFSSPNISGYCYERDANSVVLRQYWVNASRPVSNVSTASVTFVGVKGACDLQARVTIAGGSVSIGQVVTAVVPGVEQNVDIGGPALVVASPAANFVTTGTTVAVSGTATDDAQVQSVTVNNVAQTLTSTNNPNDPREVAFSTTVNLPTLGAHTIATRATDIAGKVTTDTRTVFRKAQPVITWNLPAAIPFGTALSSTQLNAVARVDGVVIPGTMAYTPGATTVLPVGEDQPLSVTFTPSDQTRYLPATAGVTIDVFASQPTIAWPAPASIQYGTPLGAAQLNASASIAGAAVAGTFAYLPAAGTVLGAGTHQLSVTFTPGDPSYQSATASVSLTVTEAPLTVTANGASRTYGADNPAFSAAFAGFVAGDDPGDLGGALAFTTSAVPASDVGSYAVTPGGLTSGNYAITFVAGTLAVTPAPLTVTAANASREYGAANPEFGASFSGFVLSQSQAVLGGTLTFETSAQPGSPVGSYQVTPSGLTSGNYAITFVAGTLSITPATLTVTVAPATRLYGAANPAFALQFGAFRAGDTATVVTGTPTFTTDATGESAVGQYAVTPGGVTAGNYAITFLAGTLSITPAPLTVTADAATRGYGQPTPAFTASYAGFVLGQGPDVLGGTLTFDTNAQADSPVGNYALTPSGLTSTNYAIAFVAGTLSVTAGTLQVTAADAERAYGAANPALVGIVSGLVASDGIAVSYETDAVAGSPVGGYAIEPVLSDPNGRLGNYVLTLTPGTLNVTPATLVVTAASATRGYGQPNPPLDAAFDGFVLGQTPGDLGGALEVATTATETSGVGQYPVTASGLTSTNYAISYVAGTLTVAQAQLQVTADDAARAFGDDNPALTGTAIGLVAADGIGVSYTTTAGATSPVGEYAIQPVLADPNGRLGNYLVTLTPGSLEVTRRPLTVTANDVTRGYGASAPAFSAGYSGFAPGDGPASLGGTLGFGGPAATATAVGSYEIVPSGLSSSNYEIAFVNGTLTIAQASLTITANSQTRVYGAAPAGFAVSYAGFVNGDDPSDLTGTLTFGGTAPGAVNVGGYSITPAGLSSINYAVSFVDGTLTVTPAALTIRADNKSMVLGGSLPAFTATYEGFVNGDTPASLDTPAALGTTATGQAVGSFSITASGAADANYAIAFASGSLTVAYSLGACLGEAGHTILQPVNADGTSVFKQKSTVPLKFRVCDANGASVSSGVVGSFMLVQKVSGTATLDVNETPSSTTPDVTFRWDASAEQWIFNLNTKNLQAGQTYRYQIGLLDGTAIPFQFGLR